MYIQFYFAVFISAAAFAASENSGDGLNIAAISKANVRVDGSRRNQTDERTKRSVSDSDRDTILNAFNCQRSLVGASNMNYLSWSFALENDVNSHIQNCNFDTQFSSTTDDSFVLKRIVSTNVGHKSAVEAFFASSAFMNHVTSKYLLQVSGGYKYCSGLIEGGSLQYNVHFYAYGISVTSNFSAIARQYTSGNACTRCQDGVNWCYNKLCRGDCENSTRGCCPITNNIPAQCGSSDPICQSTNPVDPPKARSGSSRTEIRAIIVMLAIVSALRSYFL